MAEFIWDPAKEKNVLKHGVDFTMATQVFLDSDRKIFIDDKHTQNEERYFCLGKVKGRGLTVRFLNRDKDPHYWGGFLEKGEEIL